MKNLDHGKMILIKYAAACVSSCAFHCYILSIALLDYYSSAAGAFSLMFAGPVFLNQCSDTSSGQHVKA